MEQDCGAGGGSERLAKGKAGGEVCRQTGEQDVIIPGSD